MSPTHFYKNGNRFYNYSQEEDRMHVHVRLSNGSKIKIWLEPILKVAKNQGVKDHEISILLEDIKENIDVIKAYWEERRRN